MTVAPAPESSATVGLEAGPLERIEVRAERPSCGLPAERQAHAAEADVDEVAGRVPSFAVAGQR